MFGETAFKSIFYDIPVQQPVNPCNNSEETVGIINDKRAKHHKCVHLENHKKIYFPLLKNKCFKDVNAKALPTTTQQLYLFLIDKLLTTFL